MNAVRIRAFARPYIFSETFLEFLAYTGAISFRCGDGGALSDNTWVLYIKPQTMREFVFESGTTTSALRRYYRP